MKKYLLIALVFVLATSLLMAGCSKKKVSEAKLPGEGVVVEDTKAKLPGRWVLDKIEHDVPEDQFSSSEIFEESYQAECGDTYMRITWSSSWLSKDFKKTFKKTGTLEASFAKFPESFAPGEEASITINTQSSFSAGYESDEFKNGRSAEAYIYTPSRNDVMTSQERLYAPAPWYETRNYSKDIPLKMPADAQGGEIVQFRIVLNEVPLLNKPPAVTYTYKWVE